MWTTILSFTVVSIFLKLLYQAKLQRSRTKAKTRDQLYADVHDRENEAEARCLPYIVTTVRKKQYDNNSRTIEQLADWLIANPYAHSYVEHEVDYQTGAYNYEPDPDGCYTVRTYDPLAIRWAREGIALSGFEIVTSASHRA